MGSPSLAAIIEIQNDGEIVLDGRVIDLRSVRANVERLLASDRKRISIIAQENAPTGVVSAVVDEIHLGGIYDITFQYGPADRRGEMTLAQTVVRAYR